MNSPLRPALPADLPALAGIWHQGWHQAHAEHVPDSLTCLRTLENFRARLEKMLPDIITLGPPGAPLGFCAVRGHEIYQMFVAPTARGTSAAGALLSEGVARIFAAGHHRAKLDVIPENTRAVAFYEKMGWQRQSIREIAVDTLAGAYPLRCLIMTKLPDQDSPPVNHKLSACGHGT